MITLWAVLTGQMPMDELTAVVAGMELGLELTTFCGWMVLT